MFALQRLRPDHEPAVLAFERANRAYFAESISDRGDEFFEQFAERHRALLADQHAGVCAYYVLVADEGKVVGRFNLYDLVDGTAEVGYRVAERVAGRGVATSGLQDLCRIAGEQYGLQTLRAATSSDNVASQRVLTKVGFVATGPAEVGGRQGSRYELVLEPPGTRLAITLDRHLHAGNTHRRADGRSPWQMPIHQRTLDGRLKACQRAVGPDKRFADVGRRSLESR